MRWYILDNLTGTELFSYTTGLVYSNILGKTWYMYININTESAIY
jgi:hypothetical protein